MQPDDQTLLFTNSGMVQFKKKFLGLDEANTAYGEMKRACNYQKCIRAGGKHNDLDDVGKDTYHHTFFEMLGNWSFGDYFKEHAIERAWVFLTEILGLEKDRIYVSYFKGEDGVPADKEAQKIWEKYLPADRVLGYGGKENFWEMGNSGPCGPCTEIHYDRIGGRDASMLVNADDPDVLEIWNIVFIQYNKDESGKLEALPKKHVDTGMGLERVLSILQGHRSNYRTDLFTYLLKEIERRAECAAYADTLGSKLDVSYRVVADHSRTLAIALMDGVMPASEGKGYVIRRILRRALGFQYMHIKKQSGLLPELVRMSIEYFRYIYFADALDEEIDKAVQIVEEEEKQFTKTLARGVELLEQRLQQIKATEEKTISGEDAFILYDRYGFPIDLTVAVAEQEGVSVDIERFKEKQKEAKEVSRADPASVLLVLTVHDMSALNKTLPNGTEDKYKYSADTFICSRVVGIKIHENIIQTEDLDRYRDISECGIVLEKTSFYGEAGGQEGDTGQIFFSATDAPSQKTDKYFVVKDTQKFGKYVMHIGCLVGGVLPYGTCAIDMKRRKRLAASHTSTHILNFALFYSLGNMHTCGSLVSEGRLRLDFTWPKPLTPKQIETVENRMNEIVKAKKKVTVSHMEYAEALKIKGIRMLKGEEYPEEVRVVSVGEDTDKSVELCGGTHVSNTDEIQRIRVVSEIGKARGVRRITALVGDDALKAEKRAEELINRKIAEKKDVNEIREALETEILPMKEMQEIKTKLIEHQRQVQQEKKAHFEREAQRLRKETEEKEGPVIFRCVNEQALTPSLIGKGLSMLAGILEKEKRNGVIIYAGDSSTSLCASCPGAVDLLKDALHEDSSLTAGGKGSRAFGTTALSAEKAELLLAEQLKRI